MKKPINTRKWTAVLLAACLTLTTICWTISAKADSVTEDGLKYVILRGEVKITGFDRAVRLKTDGSCRVPAGCRLISVQPGG